MSRGKKLGILCLVLVAAVIAYFGAKMLSQKTENADKTSVMQIKNEDIIGLKWNYNGEDVSITKGENGWAYVGDDTFEVDQTKVDAILNQISGLMASEVLTKEEQTEDYGFTAPKAQVVVSTKTADTTYTFGNLNSITNEYYLKITGSENIFMVPQTFMTIFEKGKTEMQAPTPTPAPEQTEAALTSGTDTPTGTAAPIK